MDFIRTTQRHVSPGLDVVDAELDGATQRGALRLVLTVLAFW